MVIMDTAATTCMPESFKMLQLVHWHLKIIQGQPKITIVQPTYYLLQVFNGN